MSLRKTDQIFIPAEAIEYLEKVESKEGSLAKFEIIELFFEWLQHQPRADQADFLRKALSHD